MRRPQRRLATRGATRAALGLADIPTFNGPRIGAETPDAIRWIRAPGQLPKGRRVYAIGDVHGHRDQLVALHRMITEDLAARPAASAVLVHLGDYINQGPDSAGVLDVLCRLELPGVLIVNLLGDQERMLLDALKGDRAAATDWLWAGGRDALRSWGLDPDLPKEAWPSAFPAAHLAFLRGLMPWHQEGHYVFVHAGIRPGVLLRDQSINDLTAIRQDFLASETDFGAVVVHGHSSNPTVPILPNRIGLDTGAGVGGKLTAAVLEDDVMGLLSA